MMIGFIAGVSAGLLLGLNHFESIDATNPQLLLGIAAAGYAGADFIENSFARLLPAVGGVKVGAPGVAASVKPTAPSPPSPTFPNLTAALKTVAPKVDTSIWAPALNDAFTKFNINSNRRCAGAIGQFLAEASAAFQERVENLSYTSASRLADIFPSAFPTEAAAPYAGKPEEIGNKVYAGVNGNGDEASGDGYRFRGRGSGLIQLTGRDEYAEFATAMGMTPEQAVDYCLTPAGAAMSGC